MLTAQIEHLSAAIARLMPVALDGAAKGTVLLVIAWMVIPRMPHWSSAARHMAWLACLASLLVLPLLGWALPGWQILPESWDLRQVAVSHRTVEGAPVAADHQQVVPASAPRVDQPAAAPAVAPAALPVTAPVQRTLRPITVLGWVGIIWLTGAALLVLRLAVGLASLLWASLRLPLCRDEQWQSAMLQACSDLGIRRRVRLLQGRSQVMPMTWGILRPHLLVPADGGTWSPQRRRVVLLHELAHVKRWDCLTQLVAQIACAGLWFHPMAWIASKRMQNEAERACDDLVLLRGSRAAEYADHLLQIAASQHQGYLAAAMAAIPMARASKLEGRLLAILDGRRPRRGLTLGALVLAATLAAGVVVPVAMLRAAGKAAEPAKGAPVAPASGQAVASLPGGLTIEVAGVSFHPSEGQQWWAADGTPFDEVPFVTSKSSVAARNTKGREFVLRVTGDLSADAGIIWHALSANGQASGPVRPATGPANGRLMYTASPLPLQDESATIRVGVATGPWVTLEDAQANGMIARGGIRNKDGTRKGPTIFGPAFESDGGTGISVTHTPVEGQVRIVAIDKDGQTHETGDITSGSAEGMSQTTAHFAGLLKNRVKSFRLQARPFQWIEFRNVSIEPGHKTQVQVQIEPPPEAGDVLGAAGDALPAEPSPQPVVAASSRPSGKSESEMLTGLSQEKRRELAKRALSAANMQQILRGVYLCMSKGNSQWPVGLRTIVEKGLGKTGDEAAQILTNPRWPDRTPAYIYVKPAVPVTSVIDPGKTVALYEAYDEWGDGINVGFLDGHVMFTNDEALFRDLLEHPAVVPAARPAMRGNTDRSQVGSSRATGAIPWPRNRPPPSRGRRTLKAPCLPPSSVRDFLKPTAR